jgi:hypothetical protein
MFYNNGKFLNNSPSHSTANAVGSLFKSGSQNKDI